MSKFTGNIVISAEDDDLINWSLLSNLVYEVGFLGSGKLISIPIGFITDGASIPPILKGLLPAWGRYSRAAIVHDYLYKSIKNGTPHPEAMSHGIADDIFLEAMLVSKVNKFLAYFMWISVKIYHFFFNYK